eukprot:CFRG8421T1
MSANVSGAPVEAEAEEQFLLRLPEGHAARLRKLIKDNALHDQLTFNFADMRHVKVALGEADLVGTLLDLPCVVECQKTLDGINFYKSADICQMILCEEEKDAMDVDEPNNGKPKKKKPYQYAHGITPPLKNVRRRRWRKTAPNKFNQEQDIENEVRNLRLEDARAVSYTYNVIEVNEADDDNKELDEDEDEDVGEEFDVGTPAVSMGRGGGGGTSLLLGVRDINKRDGGNTSATATEAEASDAGTSDAREDEEDIDLDDDDMEEEIGQENDDSDLGLRSSSDDEDDDDEQMGTGNQTKADGGGASGEEEDDLPFIDYSRVIVEGEEPENAPQAEPERAPMEIHNESASIFAHNPDDDDHDSDRMSVGDLDDAINTEETPNKSPLISTQTLPSQSVSSPSRTNEQANTLTPHSSKLVAPSIPAHVSLLESSAVHTPAVDVTEIPIETELLSENVSGVVVDDQKVMECESELASLHTTRNNLRESVAKQINPRLKIRFQTQLDQCEGEIALLERRLMALRNGEQ